MPDPVYAFEGEFAFLSNFYMHPIRFESMDYPSSEHAYQAAKTTDRAARARIARLETAGQAKRAGKKVPLRPGWEIIKVSVMKVILYEKFTDPVLMDKLIATGDRELIEGNTWGDRFWGVYKGKGQNMLGRLLMEVRQDLSGGTIYLTDGIASPASGAITAHR